MMRRTTSKKLQNKLIKFCVLLQKKLQNKIFNEGQADGKTFYPEGKLKKKLDWLTSIIYEEKLKMLKSILEK